LEAIERVAASVDSAYEALLVRLATDNPSLHEQLWMLHTVGIGRKPSVRGPFAREWPFVSNVHERVTEVHRSLRSLRNVPTYIRQFPFRSIGIPRSEYLQYHLENWFSEFFILDERFRALCTTIERAAWADEDRDFTIDWVGKIRVNLASGLEQARSVRNVHVHQRRVTDFGVNSLCQIEAAVDGDGSGQARRLLDREFRDQRRQLADSLNEGNVLLGIAVEDCFSVLEILLLDAEGALRTPLSNKRIERTPRALS